MTWKYSYDIHPLQNTYRSMISRCYHKGNTSYRKYGGKGITVCERWRRSRMNGHTNSEGFKNFLEDMGPKPDPSYTLDRIDNNGNYCPENCRWASRKQQALNRNPYVNKGLRGTKNHNHVLTEAEVVEIKTALLNPYHGVTADLARKYGCDRTTISCIKLGKTWDWVEPHST